MKDADEGGGVASDDNETSRPGGPNDESLVFEQGTSGGRGGGSVNGAVGLQRPTWLL